jgi:hypothetical protein
MISRVLIFILLTASAVLADVNTVILEEIRRMPAGGGYATNLQAHAALASSIEVKDSVEYPTGTGDAGLLLRRDLPRLP